MTLRGDLKTLPLADLVQTLGQGANTGTLIVEQRGVARKFVFEGGSIRYSWSSDPREQLGAFLVDGGLVDRGTLEQGMRLREESGVHLGQALVTLGAVGVSELQRAIQLKTEKSLGALMASSEGNFEFRENELPRAPMVPASLDVMGVVLASGVWADSGIHDLPEPVTLSAHLASVEPESADREPTALEVSPVQQLARARLVERQTRPGGDVSSWASGPAKFRLALLTGALVILLALIVADTPWTSDPLVARSDDFSKRSRAGAGDSEIGELATATLEPSSLGSEPAAGFPADASEAESEGPGSLEPPPEVLQRVQNLLDERAAEIEASVRKRYQSELDALRQELASSRQETSDTAPEPGAKPPAKAARPAPSPPTVAAGVLGEVAENPAGRESTIRAQAEPDVEVDEPAAIESAPAAAAGPTRIAEATPQRSRPSPASDRPNDGTESAARPVVVGPRVLERPQPYYPRAGRLSGSQGTVVLKVLVGPEGRVVDLEQITAPLGFGLDASARQAARKSQWQPGTVDGEATSMWAQLRFDFALVD